METMTVQQYKDSIKKSGTKKGHPEHDEQVKVFEWASIMSSKIPALKLLMAIPNGAYYGGHWSVANRMKAEGVRSGVPDIFLPVMMKWGRRECLNVVGWDVIDCGLWIEMKVGKNKPSPDQEWWLDQLAEQGYRTRVCYSAQEAIDEIEEYLTSEDD